jgi:hypothetical protein
MRHSSSAISGDSQRQGGSAPRLASAVVRLVALAQVVGTRAVPLRADLHGHGAQYGRSSGGTKLPRR